MLFIYCLNFFIEMLYEENAEPQCKCAGLDM